MTRQQAIHLIEWLQKAPTAKQFYGIIPEELLRYYEEQNPTLCIHDMERIKIKLTEDQILLMNMGNVSHFSDRIEYTIPFKIVKEKNNWYIIYNAVYDRNEVIKLIKEVAYSKENAWKVGELDKWIKEKL